MKLKLLIAFMFIGLFANAQSWQPIAGWQRFTGKLGIPVRDTISTGNANDTAQIVARPQDSTVYFKYKGYWRTLVPIIDSASYTKVSRFLDSMTAIQSRINATTGKFNNNIVLNGGAGNRLGYWVDGETIPVAGMAIDSAFKLITQRAVAPTYIPPTVSISSSPGSGSYERGTNLGTITLSRSFTQNDAGAVGASVYSKYVSSWVDLGSNTDAVTSLTGIIYYRVTTSYAQGACKNNNLGTPDCTGRINAGSVVSANIQFTPFDKRYWGFVNSTSPSNSDVLALSQDNNGATGSLSLTNITPTGSQFFAYLTKGIITTIVVNGIPATDAFTITTRTVTNAQGFASTYSYIYSNQAQTQTINSITFN